MIQFDTVTGLRNDSGNLYFITEFGNDYTYTYLPLVLVSFNSGTSNSVNFVANIALYSNRQFHVYIGNKYPDGRGIENSTKLQWLSMGCM